MYDSHIHSEFSADCKTPLADIVQSAIQKGIKTITITDHIDYLYLGGDSFEFDPQSYDKTLKEYQFNYRNEIEILKGLELGLQPHVLEMCKQLVSKETFDFIIASVHGCQKEDFYFGNFFDDKTPQEAMEIYLDELYVMIMEFKCFNVLGHIDLPKRYNADVAKLDPASLMSRYEKIFKLLISRGQGIELNTSGLRQDVGVQFPDKSIIELYYDLGGRIITLGSDSHTADSLTSGFEEAIELLKSIGYEAICTFKDGKVRYHRFD